VVYCGVLWCGVMWRPVNTLAQISVAVPTAVMPAQTKHETNQRTLSGVDEQVWCGVCDVI